MIEIDVLTPNDSPRRLIRSRTIRLLRGLGLPLAVAAAAWLAAPATSRAGIQTDYVLSNVTAVFDGTPVSISGSFILGGGEWRAQIQVTGPSPYAGFYSCSACESNGILYPQFPTGANLAAGGLQMSFNGLGSGTNPVVTSVKINGVTGTDPTGVAVVTGRAIDYTFSNASAVLNGKSESITGYFTFDPLTDIEYIAILSLNGLAGYDFDAEQLGTSFIEVNGPLGVVTQIVFANDLSFGTDPLAEVFWGAGAIDNAPTGVVCAEGGACPTAAPEPTSLALLGAGLGLFLARHRGTRRVGQPRADQPEGA
jgi:hypothetical protein